MSLYKIVAIALIVAGTLGLIYGGFNYTKETHEAEIGPLSLSVDETEYVNVPIWAGVAGIVIGALLLVMPKKS
jgi:TRAP-type C4-dicarboxylate transport system permease small subunit